MRRLARRTDDGRISVAELDEHQVLAYDLAHAASAVEGCRVMLDYGGHGELESKLARAFIADAIADLGARLIARDDAWGVEPGASRRRTTSSPRTARRRSSRQLAEQLPRARHRSHAPRPTTSSSCARRSTGSPRTRSVPSPSTCTATNADIPEEVIAGLAEIGGFGLSVPEEYGGFAVGGEHDYLGMVVATEELSWGSLGVGGSLITRPEILTRAIVQGGTEEQKQRWLPRSRRGELMVGVMVTEPDYGSDVAGVKVDRDARPTAATAINGVKTWATFAGRANVLMLLARTDPDRSAGHRGLSLFVVDKEPAPGHAFAFTRTAAGTIEGRAIDTHRLPRHALVRGRVRRLVRAGREPRRRGGGLGQGLLPPDGGIRERPAPDRGRAPSA